MMATAKKKPTAAQLAARKLFAQRAKAGTLKKNPSRKKAVKKNPTPKVAHKVAVKKTTVQKNPKKTYESGYAVYAATVSAPWLGTFATLKLAKEAAQTWADKTFNSYRIKKV